MRPCLNVQIACVRKWRCSELVQASLATPAQGRALQPVEHEDRPLDTADLAKCEVELVLTLVCSELIARRSG
jgi:hypothetical protein